MRGRAFLEESNGSPWIAWIESTASPAGGAGAGHDLWSFFSWPINDKILIAMITFFVLILRILVGFGSYSGACRFLIV